MSNEKLPILTRWNEDRMKGSGRCYQGKNYWYEHQLWEAARLDKLEPFDLPLAAIPIGHIPWDINDMEDVMYHFQKVKEADLKYPITLDDMGQVMDGYHRIVKAIMEGHTTIKAVRFINLPEKSGTDANS